MNANVIPMNTNSTPIVREPSPRLMRVVGQEKDRYHHASGELVERELQPGETGINWKPRLLPLFSFPHMPQADIAARGSDAVQAGNAVAIVRPGYEGAPLGIATDMYRPVDHHETVGEVAESTKGRATLEGAIIDGHGYHVVHAFKLETPMPEKVTELADAHDVILAIADEPPTVRGLPLISRLTLVHDHTGGGSLRASVVCYLGKEIVVGSACFTRRIHVGTGKRNVGVGSKATWLAVVDKMLDTAILQQTAIATLLTKAAETPMTEAAAAEFEARGVFVERERVSADEKKAAAERGEPEPVGAIVEATALDVVIAYHKPRKGRPSWGVWSRRLEGDALTALEAITGLKLPKQLFRRG